MKLNTESDYWDALKECENLLEEEEAGTITDENKEKLSLLIEVIDEYENDNFPIK